MFPHFRKSQILTPLKFRHVLDHPIHGSLTLCARVEN